MARFRQAWLLLLVGALVAAGPSGLRLLHAGVAHGRAGGDAAGTSHHSHGDACAGHEAGDDHARGRDDSPRPSAPCDDDCGVCRFLALGAACMPDAASPLPRGADLSALLPELPAQLPPPAPLAALSARPPPAR